MELQLLSFPLLSTLIIFILILFKFLKPSNPNLPPGPWKLPLIGNLHQFSNPLHQTLATMAKKHGPLMHLQLGQLSTIIISSPEVTKQIMKTHDLIFAYRPLYLASRSISYNYTNIGFSPYGNYWRQLRKICAEELFSPNKVLSFRQIREQEVSNLIKWIISNKGSAINVTQKIYSLTYSITSRAAFGKKFEEQDQFIEIAKEYSKLLGGFCFADMYPSIKILEVISGMRIKLEKIFKKTDRILQKIVDVHRERKKNGDEDDDFVDNLLRIQEYGSHEFSLTENNIKAVIMDIFTAGSETSSTTLEWAMSELIKNPKIMKEAQNEVRRIFHDKQNVDETRIHHLKYLNSVIKETLRLHPPGPLLFPRESIQNCTINGYQIPAKTKAIINAYAIGRDPRYWDDPEKFDPNRFLNSSIDFRGNDFDFTPFGGGRRICPGIFFAIPNLQLPLASLLFHFDWTLPNGMKNEDLDMIEEFGVTTERKNPLVLVPIPHFPLHVEKGY